MASHLGTLIIIVWFAGAFGFSDGCKDRGFSYFLKCVSWPVMLIYHLGYWLGKKEAPSLRPSN